MGEVLAPPESDGLYPENGCLVEGLYQGLGAKL